MPLLLRLACQKLFPAPACVLLSSISPHAPPPAAATLAAAIAGWQSERSLGHVLTTGFLDGSHPLVDNYELAVVRTRAAGGRGCCLARCLTATNLLLVTAPY